MLFKAAGEQAELHDVLGEVLTPFVLYPIFNRAVSQKHRIAAAKTKLLPCLVGEHFVNCSRLHLTLVLK